MACEHSMASLGTRNRGKSSTWHNSMVLSQNRCNPWRKHSRCPLSSWAGTMHWIRAKSGGTRVSERSINAAKIWFEHRCSMVMTKKSWRVRKLLTLLPAELELFSSEVLVCQNAHPARRTMIRPATALDFILSSKAMGWKGCRRVRCTGGGIERNDPLLRQRVDVQGDVAYSPSENGYPAASKRSFQLFQGCG